MGEQFSGRGAFDPSGASLRRCRSSAARNTRDASAKAPCRRSSVGDFPSSLAVTRRRPLSEEYPHARATLRTVRPESSSSSAACSSRIHKSIFRGLRSSELYIQRSRLLRDVESARAMSRPTPPVLTTSAATSRIASARPGIPAGSTRARSSFMNRPSTRRNRSRSASGASSTPIAITPARPDPSSAAARSSPAELNSAAAKTGREGNSATSDMSERDSRPPPASSYGSTIAIADGGASRTAATSFAQSGMNRQVKSRPASLRTWVLSR